MLFHLVDRCYAPHLVRERRSLPRLEPAVPFSNDGRLREMNDIINDLSNQIDGTQEQLREAKSLIEGLLDSTTAENEINLSNAQRSTSFCTSSNEIDDLTTEIAQLNVQDESDHEDDVGDNHNLISDSENAERDDDASYDGEWNGRPSDAFRESLLMDHNAEIDDDDVDEQEEDILLHRPRNTLA